MGRRFIWVTLVLFISAAINAYPVTDVSSLPDSFTTSLRIVDIEGRPIKVSSIDTIIIETFYDTLNTHDTILFLTSYTSISQFVEWIKYYSGNYYIKLKPGFGSKGTSADSIRGPWPPVMHEVHQEDTIYLYARIYLHIKWAPFEHAWNDQLSYVRLLYLWDSTTHRYILQKISTVQFDPLTIGRTNKHDLYKEGLFWGLNLRKIYFHCDTTATDTICYLHYPIDLELIHKRFSTYDRYFILNSLNMCRFIADSDSAASKATPIKHIINAGFIDDVSSILFPDTSLDGIGYITDISTHQDTYVIVINGITKREYRFSGITESDSLDPIDSVVVCKGYGVSDSVLYFRVHNDTAVIILKALASDSFYIALCAIVKVDTTIDSSRYLTYIDYLPVGIFKIPRRTSGGGLITRLISYDHSGFHIVQPGLMPIVYDTTSEMPDTIGAPLFRWVALTKGIITRNDSTKLVAVAIIKDTVLIWDVINDTTVMFGLPISVDTTYCYTEIASQPNDTLLTVFILDNDDELLYILNIDYDLSWDTTSIHLPYFGQRKFVFATTCIDTGPYYEYPIGCNCDTSDTVCDSLKWDYELIEPITKYSYHTLYPLTYDKKNNYYMLLELNDSINVRSDSVIYFWSMTIKDLIEDAFDSVQWIDVKPTLAGRSNLLHQPFIYYKLPGSWHWDIRGGTYGPAVGWNNSSVYHELNCRYGYLLSPIRNNLSDGRLRYCLRGYRNYPLRVRFVYNDPNGTSNPSGVYPCVYRISLKGKYFSSTRMSSSWYWAHRVYPRYSYDFQIETDPGTVPEMIIGTWTFTFTENTTYVATYTDTIFIRNQANYTGIRYYIEGFDFANIDSLFITDWWEYGYPWYSTLQFDFYFIDYTPPRSGASITVLGYLNKHQADTLFKNDSICGRCIDTLTPYYVNVVHRTASGLISLTNGFIGLIMDREFDFRNDGWLQGIPTYYWDKNAETWHPAGVDSYIIDLHIYYGRPGFIDATPNCIITYNGYRYRSRHVVNPNEYGTWGLRRRRFWNGIKLPP